MTVRDMHIAICREYDTCSYGCPLKYCGAVQAQYDKLTEIKIIAEYHKIINENSVSDEEYLSVFKE